MMRFWALFFTLCSVSAFAQPEASVRVATEVAPPGGLALVQIELTEPKPILTGDITVGKRGSALTRICGFGLFSSALDVIGVATEQGDLTRVRFLGFSGQVGNTQDLPVMTVAVEIDPNATPGSQGSIEIVESTLRLESPNGTVYINDLKPGTVTVGGVSITSISPASGLVPAGTRITFNGVGFTASSRIDIEGVTLNNVQYVSPTQMVATAGQTFRVENSRIRLRNDGGVEDFFYAFTPTKLTPTTSNPLLRSAFPIFSPQTLTQSRLTVTTDMLGLAVHNPHGLSSTVKVSAYSAADQPLASREITLGANGQSTLALNEWMPGLSAGQAALVTVESSQPVQTLGLRYEDNSFAPSMLSEGAPPVPAPTPTPPRISPGGWVMGTLSPVETTLAPLALSTIFGLDFAPSGFTRDAGPGDLVNSALPTSLGGICVEINGQRAPLFFVSATQINLQAPALSAGSATAVVIRGCGTAEETRSAPETVLLSPRRPALFVLRYDDPNDANPVAALHGGGPLVAAAPAQVAGATPAAPDEVVSLFATGLGATNPPLPAGAIPLNVAPDGLARVTGAASVQIGGIELTPDDILYVGAAPCCAGLYQIVVRTPADLPTGDHPVVIGVDGALSPIGPTLHVVSP